MILVPIMASLVSQIASIRFQMASQLCVGASCIMTIFPYPLHFLYLSSQRVKVTFMRSKVTALTYKVTFLGPEETSLRPRVTSLGHKLTTISPE